MYSCLANPENPDERDGRTLYFGDAHRIAKDLVAEGGEYEYSSDKTEVCLENVIVNDVSGQESPKTQAEEDCR